MQKISLHAGDRRAILAALIAATLAISLFGLYGRWTLFVPSERIEQGRTIGWVVLFAGIATALLFRIMHRKKKGEISTGFLTILALVLFSSLALSFYLREVLTGAGALVNSKAASNATVLCVRVDKVTGAGRGAWERTHFAELTVFVDRRSYQSKLEFLPSRISLETDAGKSYELHVKEGPLGYTIEQDSHPKKVTTCDI